MLNSSWGAQRSGQAIIASSVNKATPARLRRGGRRIARFAPAWRDNLDGSAARSNALAGQLVAVTPHVGREQLFQDRKRARRDRLFFTMTRARTRPRLDAAQAQLAQGRAA